MLACARLPDQRHPTSHPPAQRDASWEQSSGAASEGDPSAGGGGAAPRRNVVRINLRQQTATPQYNEQSDGEQEAAPAAAAEAGWQPGLPVQQAAAAWQPALPTQQAAMLHQPAAVQRWQQQADAAVAAPAPLASPPAAAPAVPDWAAHLPAPAPMPTSFQPAQPPWMRKVASGSALAGGSAKASSGSGAFGGGGKGGGGGFRSTTPGFYAESDDDDEAESRAKRARKVRAQICQGGAWHPGCRAGRAGQPAAGAFAAQPHWRALVSAAPCSLAPLYLPGRSLTCCCQRRTWLRWTTRWSASSATGGQRRLRRRLLASIAALPGWLAGAWLGPAATRQHPRISTHPHATPPPGLRTRAGRRRARSQPRATPGPAGSSLSSGRAFRTCTAPGSSRPRAPRCAPGCRGRRAGVLLPSARRWEGRGCRRVLSCCGPLPAAARCLPPATPAPCIHALPPFTACLPCAAAGLQAHPALHEEGGGEGGAPALALPAFACPSCVLVGRVGANWCKAGGVGGGAAVAFATAGPARRPYKRCQLLVPLAPPRPASPAASLPIPPTPTPHHACRRGAPT